MKTMKTLGMGSKKYQLDRKKFIEYYPVEIWGMLEISQVTDDLIKGSEFVLTAEDILKRVEYIDGKLFTPPISFPLHHSVIELTYNQE